MAGEISHLLMPDLENITEAQRGATEAESLKALTRAAEHPSTPDSLLRLLAKHSNLDVRLAVTENPTASLDVLLMLCEDEHADLRYQLAENHNLHPSLLRLLTEDDNPYVAHRAQKTLTRLACNSKVEVYSPMYQLTLVGRFHIPPTRRHAEAE